MMINNDKLYYSFIIIIIMKIIIIMVKCNDTIIIITILLKPQIWYSAASTVYLINDFSFYKRACIVEKLPSKFGYCLHCSKINNSNNVINK